MNFTDLIGQKRQINQLLANRERMPHAMLISGPEGSGKLPFGLAVAKWIFCQGNKAEDACGECSNCRKVEKFNHPDLHFSFPVFGRDVLPSHKFAEWKEAVLDNPYMGVSDWREVMDEPSKQPNISAKATLEIIKSLQLQAFEKGPRLHLIWMAEYLGKEGNRLLKLIEEPPENAFLILIAEKSDRILPTIQSRCQSITLNPLDDQELAQKLMDSYGMGKEEALKFASWSEGNINKALFLASEGGKEISKRWVEWMRLTFQQNNHTLVNWISERSREGKASIKAILQYGTYFLREVLEIKGNMEANYRKEDEMAKSAQKMSAFLSVGGIIELTGMINKSIYHLERNANDKILMMDFSLQMGNILTSDFKANRNN